MASCKVSGGGSFPSGVEEKKRLRVYNNDPESLLNYFKTMAKTLFPYADGEIRQSLFVAVRGRSLHARSSTSVIVCCLLWVFLSTFLSVGLFCRRGFTEMW